MKFPIGVCLSLTVLGALAMGACSDSAPTPPTTVTPTPTPVPAPTPTPVGTCSLAPMPDCGLTTDCCHDGGTPLFKREIGAAQNAVRENNPGWFRPDGSLKVSDVQYTSEVAEQITELFGLCARGGDERNPPGGHSISADEVGIKRDNGLSQNTDIVVGGTHQPGILGHSTCRPAAF